jgi:hypothetical protein
MMKTTVELPPESQRRCNYQSVPGINRPITDEESLVARIIVNAGARFTTAPIHEGHLSQGLPEFCRIKTATAHTGLSRSGLYQGMKDGWVRSVSLRKKGQKFAVRLIHLPSLVEHLHSLMEAQQTEQDNTK